MKCFGFLHESHCRCRADLLPLPAFVEMPINLAIVASASSIDPPLVALDASQGYVGS